MSDPRDPNPQGKGVIPDLSTLGCDLDNTPGPEELEVGQTFNVQMSGCYCARCRCKFLIERSLNNPICPQCGLRLGVVKDAFIFTHGTENTDQRETAGGTNPEATGPRTQTGHGQESLNKHLEEIGVDPGPATPDRTPEDK